MTFTEFSEIIDNYFVKSDSQTHNHSAIKSQITERIFKLIPIHASLIHKIPWIRWIHWTQ